jgi:ankyrin repeat protein
MIDFADSERHTALHAACAFGYEDCVSLLIQAGATLDMADDEGDTPLDGALMASSDSGQACADLLLAAGAAKETPLRALGHSLAVVAHCHEWAGDLTATAFPS